MCAAIDQPHQRQQQQQQPVSEETTVGVRIELVDDWHERWPQVLTQIERAGHRDAVRVSEHGYLSARENVLAAVVGDRVAAHLSFHVQPGNGVAAVAGAARPCVEAEVDSYGIDPDFRNRGIERVLRQTAIERARVLRCAQMKGFDLAESWS
jgi:GNAT superfamily N-acetyltransferase